MRDLIGKAELLGSRRTVAAADDGDRAALGERLGHGLRAGRKGWELKNAHGAVPHDRARALGRRAEELDGLGADVHAHHIRGDVHRVDDVGLCVGGELRRGDGIDRQQELDALLLGLLHHVLAIVDLLCVKQALADAVALSS